MARILCETEGTLNLLSFSCTAPRGLTVPSLLVTSPSLTNKKTFCRRTNPSPCSEQMPVIYSDQKVLTSPWFWGPFPGKVPSVPYR